MQIFGDLQRRPNKRRTMAENIYIQINALLTLGMLCALVVGTVMSTARSSRTFNHNMWAPNVHLELVEPLKYKTINCTRTVSYDSYGYGTFQAQISGENLIDALAVIAGETRTNLIIAYVVLLLAFLNRALVDANFYFLRYRNYVVRKSALTTVELFLAIVGIAGISAVEREAAPVRDYLQQCGVTATRTLPFDSPLVYLYVFYGMEFFQFAMAIVLLLNHGLKKPAPGVVDEWLAEQYEVVKPKTEIDERRHQIVVAADGTPIGRASAEELEELRNRHRRAISNTNGGNGGDNVNRNLNTALSGQQGSSAGQVVSPTQTPQQGGLTPPNGPLAANNTTNNRNAARGNIYSPRGTTRYVNRTGATPIAHQAGGGGGRQSFSNNNDGNPAVNLNRYNGPYGTQSGTNMGIGAPRSHNNDIAQGGFAGNTIVYDTDLPPTPRYR